MVIDFKDIESSQLITGIPIVHYDSYLNNFEDRYGGKFYTKLLSITDKILSLDISKTPKYVFLCGMAGSGKSHFMVGLYRALIYKLGYLQGEGALFTTFASLSEEIIGMFKLDIPLRVSLKGFTQSKWLFLDDFTSSERVLKPDSLEYNMFRDILIDRYEKQNILITSSNIKSLDLLAEMDKLFGGYITSRLNDSEVISFPDKDFRRIKR